jgi:hypothetical protein
MTLRPPRKPKVRIVVAVVRLRRRRDEGDDVEGRRLLSSSFIFEMKTARTLAGRSLQSRATDAFGYDAWP